jgi:UDP-N-acetylmuramyl tripeptide synthase
MIGTFIGKAIIFVENIFKYNASSFPGRMVLKLFSNYLNKLKYPGLIIIVTGSSGKGSTTKYITDTLRKNKMKVVHNDLGSNLLDGVTTAIIKETKGKKINADALVLEVDERYLKYVTKYIKANVIAVNSITRDQPPRQGSYEEVFNEICKGLNSDSLVLNADDPLLKRFEDHFDGKIVYYGIDKNQYSFKELDDVKDNAYCPKCHTKLVYDYYHYSSVGDFECPKCDFDRGKINYEITSIKDNTITINEDVKIDIDNDTLFNLYNIVCTYSVCKLINLSTEQIVKALNSDKTLKKLFNEYTVNNRKYTILNCKAENNTTYNLNLLHVLKDDSEKTLVIGLRQISRRYNHFDLSWLWDINFEILKNNNVDKIICAGPYRYDIAVRIKYAGFDEKNIIIMENTDGMKAVIETKTSGNIYGILNFDYVDPFIKETKGGK